MSRFIEIGDRADGQDEVPCILPVSMDEDITVFISRSDFIGLAKAFGYSVGLVPATTNGETSHGLD